MFYQSFVGKTEATSVGFAVSMEDGAPNLGFSIK